MDGLLWLVTLALVHQYRRVLVMQGLRQPLILVVYTVLVCLVLLFIRAWVGVLVG
jgi:hypothetical protein